MLYSVRKIDVVAKEAKIAMNSTEKERKRDKNYYDYECVREIFLQRHMIFIFYVCLYLLRSYCGIEECWWNLKTLFEILIFDI